MALAAGADQIGTPDKEDAGKVARIIGRFGGKAHLIASQAVDDILDNLLVSARATLPGLVYQIE